MIKLRLIVGISILLIPTLLKSQNWQSMASPLTRTVFSMYADTLTNKLYTGKDFMGVPNGLDIWNGSSWDTLGYVATCVRSINKFQGDIIVANGYIRKWNGANWVQLGTGITGPVLGLYNDNDNNLYATGWFDTIGGVPASRIAKWNGTTWSAIDTSNWSTGGASICSIIYKGELYVGGNFWNNAGTINKIAKWNGTQWQSLGSGMPGGTSVVNCLEIYNNDLYVGGSFSVSSGCPGNSIARWDGTQWLDVGGGFTGINPTIDDLKVFNGELYASGIFDVAGGKAIQDIAKWNGTNWCGLGFGNVLSGRRVCTLDVLNNELYLGGGFKDINGDTMNYVSKWIGGSFTSICGNTTGINESQINNETLNIYPNPATSHITIEFELTRTNNTIIEIKNVLGQTIKTFDNMEFLKGTNKIEIDLNEFSNGLYFVQLQNDSNIISRKFIKQ